MDKYLSTPVLLLVLGSANLVRPWSNEPEVGLASFCNRTISKSGHVAAPPTLDPDFAGAPLACHIRSVLMLSKLITQRS